MLAQANMSHNILDMELTLSFEDDMNHMQLCPMRYCYPHLFVYYYITALIIQ
jgi:hypothetical protein